MKKWFKTGKKERERAYLFGALMVWHKPKEHLNDFCFCLVNTKSIWKKDPQNIFYLSIPSAIQPVLHFDKFLPTVFNGFVSPEDEETKSEEEHIKME